FETVFNASMFLCVLGADIISVLDLTVSSSRCDIFSTRRVIVKQLQGFHMIGKEMSTYFLKGEKIMYKNSQKVEFLSYYYSDWTLGLTIGNNRINVANELLLNIYIFPNSRNLPNNC